MYQLGDVPAPAAGGGLFDSIGTTLTSIAPVLAQAYREKLAIKAQMARAQAGLPPLDISQYSPDLRVQTTVGASEDTNRTVLILAAGAAAVGALALALSRRRRR